MRRRLAGFVRQHAVGLLALFVALGGTSYAVTAKKFVRSNGTLVACAKKKTGALRLIPAGKHCRKSEQKVTWSQRGPVGANGAAGAPGTPGQAGSIQGAPAGGDLAGSYPNPTIAAEQTPVAVADNPGVATDPCFDPVPPTLVLCGTSANHWINGGFGFPGLAVWRDRLGRMHIRGSATISTTINNGQPPLFVLPVDERPPQFLAIPVVTGAFAGAQTETGALLSVEPTGFVAVVSNSGDRVVHIGDVSFRTDA